MERFSDFQGTHYVLRPSGPGRLLVSAFLGFWLCGWFTGEVVAGGILVNSLWQLVVGSPLFLFGGKPPPQAHPGVLAFLLFWLGFWTLGGLVALRLFARLLWGREHITIDQQGIELRIRAFPFNSRRRLPLGALARASLGSKALVLRDGAQKVQLGTLGTAAERAELLDLLREAYPRFKDNATRDPSPSRQADPGGAPAAVPGQGSLPSAWKESVATDGRSASYLVRDPAGRRKLGRVVGLLCLVLLASLASLAGPANRNNSLLPLILILLAFFVGALWGWLWLLKGRHEWRLGPGKLELWSVFGNKQKQLFTAQALEVDLVTDSDNDDTLVLHAVRASSSPDASDLRRHGDKRQVHRTSTDSDEVAEMAAWLQARTGLPIDDKRNPARRQEELQQLRAKLEASGPLGRLAAKLLPRNAGPSRGQGR